jgi:hypothetical protein
MSFHFVAPAAGPAGSGSSRQERTPGWQPSTGYRMWVAFPVASQESRNVAQQEPCVSALEISCDPEAVATPTPITVPVICTWSRLLRSLARCQTVLHTFPRTWWTLGWFNEVTDADQARISICGEAIFGAAQPEARNGRCGYWARHPTNLASELSTEASVFDCTRSILTATIRAPDIRNSSVGMIC